MEVLTLIGGLISIVVTVLAAIHSDNPGEHIMKDKRYSKDGKCY